MSIRSFIFIVGLTSMGVVLQGCDIFLKKDNNSAPAFNPQEIKSGGATTVFESGSNAFSRAAPNLTASQEKRHNAGDQHFESSFVTAPSKLNGGLGPLYNNTACNSCHVGDGRGKPFFDDGRISSVLVRLSMNGDEPGTPVPVPGYGLQLQNKAVFKKQSEATVEVSYDYITKKLADGTKIELRKPTYDVVDPYKSLPANTHFSVRTAPPVFGLGLLEAIPSEQILDRADPRDQDSDGISGKPNLITNTKTGKLELGRFGWKANQPTVRQQVAIAYNQDMGITTTYYPHENIYQNPGADDDLDDDPELSQQKLDETTLYAKTLAVPAKRNVNSQIVKQGKELFKQAGCQSCHVARYTTQSNTQIPALANQTIFPYTDLLLHDMGEGLADHRSDFDASGSEWRTAPLWGIGLVSAVNGHKDFMHDGRARSLLEAILWHGGEAQQAKEYVKQLPKSKRDALIAFVKAI